MPSPFKHPKTGVYWLRLRVPSDLRTILGKGEVKRSLRTKDPALAKQLFPAALGSIQREWERLRAQSADRQTPEPLTPRQIMALAGQLYRDTDDLGGQAFDAPVWAAIRALNGRLSTSPEGLERWLGAEADRLLSAAGLHADADSRRRLIGELHRAHEQAAELNERRAEGDFTPDPKATRFPVLEGSTAAAASRPGSKASLKERVALTDLLKAWEREHSVAGGSASSADDWRRIIADFIKHLGHDDATAVSPQHVSTYADHLRHERKLSAKTINGRYLAAIGSVYRLGIRKHLVKVNPAEHVKVSADKPRQLRSKGFSEGEAKVILVAAEHMSRDDALRWLPPLAAFTGARIGELVQLRRDDFREEEGIAFVRISPEGGSVKTGIAPSRPRHPRLRQGAEAR